VRSTTSTPIAASAASAVEIPRLLAVVSRQRGRSPGRSDARYPHAMQPLLFVVVALSLLAPAAPGQKTDAATQDPASRDAKDPGGAEELKIPIGTTRVNAFLYRAQGAGPHSTVVLLHGLPGNERNLDLAQTLRRAGHHVLYFNYRGTWGSGGAFSWASARQDVVAVVQHLRDPAVATKYGIDPQRIHLLGHSLGGWLALTGAVDDPGVRCTIALAPWDLGVFGAQLQSGEASRQEVTDWLQAYLDPEAGPLRGTTVDALMADAQANAPSWNFAALAQKLGNTRGLVVVSAQDEEGGKDMLKAPLEAALKGRAWTFRSVADDHGFSHHRIALGREVVAWLRDRCAAPR
jgi:uncharacterized protein